MAGGVINSHSPRVPRRNSVLRPSDEDFVRGCLRKFARRGGFDVLLGGMVHDEELTLTQFVGVQTDSLRGVRLRAGAGLGGAAMGARRAVMLRDYATAPEITHQFDRAVAREGIRSVVAAPVIVTGDVRSVVYVASRTKMEFGDRFHAVLEGFSSYIARELAIRDEVDRRVAMLAVDAQAPRADWADTVQYAHAELRSLARVIDSPEIVARVMALSQKLAHADTHAAALGEHIRPLTDREMDVLAHAALGCSNAEIASRLGLSLATVKKYMQNAMNKLGAGRRVEAVAIARKLRLIP